MRPSGHKRSNCSLDALAQPCKGAEASGLRGDREPLQGCEHIGQLVGAMIGRGAARMPAVRLTTQILQAEQHRQRRKMARHLLLGSQWRAGTVVMQGHVHNSAAAHGVGAGFMDRLTIRARMIEAQRELAIVPERL
jgi:hypothetical protein